MEDDDEEEEEEEDEDDDDDDEEEEEEEEEEVKGLLGNVNECGRVNPRTLTLSRIKKLNVPR